VVVLLACLSILLTLGGGAVAIYGADIIRLESGLALTSAGATVFSAGLVLAGLTAVLAELRRMRRLMEIDDNVAPPVAPPVPVVSRPPEPQTKSSPVAVEPPAMPVPSAEAESVPAAEQPAPLVRKPVPAHVVVEAPPPREPEPDAGKPPLPLPPSNRPTGPAGSGIPAEARAGLVGYPGLSRLKAQDEARGRIEPVLTEPLPAVAEHGSAEPSIAQTPEAPMSAAAPATRDRKPGPVSAAEPAKAAQPQAAAPQPPPAETTSAAAASSPRPAGGERTMLTSYRSGDVTYFMYSDGSIEADFPDGRRRFGSVEELRHYAEAGEGGERVPAAAASA
jgi:hypothetical protein